MKNAALIPLLLLPLLPAPLAAQARQQHVLTLKRELPPVAWQRCAAAPLPVEPGAAEREEAQRLAAAATQAAILGDNATAERQLARASALDPASAELAYRLALALEQLERPRDAVDAYCRYLALAPDAPDGEEVEARIRSLVATVGFSVPAEARNFVAAGIASYDAGRLADAEAAFGAAATAARDWGTPLYNRAVVRFADGRTEDGLDDLRQYLELSPGAADFNQVFDLILAVRDRARPPHNAGVALASGLIVPGLGHFTTGRPLTGALVLGAAGGAIGAALAIERVNVLCLTLPENGTCPPDQVVERTSERPYLGIGIAAAAAIGFMGALDAYRGARRRNAGAESLRAGPLRNGVGATVLPPSLQPLPDGVRMDVLRIRF